MNNFVGKFVPLAILISTDLQTSHKNHSKSPKEKFEIYLSKEQLVFRKKMSTIEHIHTKNTYREGCRVLYYNIIPRL